MTLTLTVFSFMRLAIKTASDFWFVRSSLIIRTYDRLVVCTLAPKIKQFVVYVPHHQPQQETLRNISSHGVLAPCTSRTTEVTLDQSGQVARNTSLVKTKILIKHYLTEFKPFSTSTSPPDSTFQRTSPSEPGP